MGQKPVILSAGEDGGGNAPDEALEDQTGVIFHVIAQREVQPDLLRVQQRHDLPQLRQVLAALQGFQFGNGPGPEEGQQEAFVGTVFGAEGPQFLLPLLAQTVQGLLPGMLGKAASVHRPADQAHMAQAQNRSLAQGSQGLCRQVQNLGNLVSAHIAHTLDARLQNLPEGTGVALLAVDILPVMDLGDGAGSLGGVLHDGQGHIGLHGKEPSVGTGKGDDPIGLQKVLVAHI